MKSFYPVVVSDIKKESEDTVSIGFAFPDELVDLFNYIPGQYLTIKAIVNNEEYRRSYSICTSPYVTRELRIAVKSVPGGVVSTYLNTDLKIGDQLEVMPPDGSFHIKEQVSSENQYVFFAGGSGITPIFSIIQTLLYADETCKVKLFYGSGDAALIIFKSDLELLTGLFKDRFSLHLVVENAIENTGIYKGRMDMATLSHLLQQYHESINSNDEYFICGPSVMMDNVKETLLSRGVNQTHIHIEYFTLSPADKLTKADIVTTSMNKALQIVLGGVKTHIDYPTKKSSVLEAALAHGLDAPFSCKEGICSTCRGKVIEGKVKMLNNMALLDEEVEEGYVLTCQSYPVSASAIISYDA
jgi:ring-1,2-phenylacetyl-CoA epoxidase subunit PaaE